MELHDYDAERALADLVDLATSQRQDSVDPDLLNRIKSTCKNSGAAIRTVYDLLYTRFKKPHSQVRLLALDISAELFHRSSLFRSLLAEKFPQFLGLVLGFKINEPLPAPTDIAGQLRQRALELIERWHSDYGTRYPQVALGYSYIRDTLRFEFPQLDVRREAEAEAQREREARAQQIAQQRYQRLLEEWQGQAVECRSLLNQYSEAFALLDKEAPDPRSNNGYNSVIVSGKNEEEKEEDGEQWEDVVEEENASNGCATIPEAAEGLAAYAAIADDDSNLDTVQINPRNNDNNKSVENRDEIDAALESIIETLDGLYKLICNQALPGVQEALRIIIRAEAGVPGEAQHTQRERLLRAATSIKAELTAAKERFEGAHLDLAALAQAQTRRREEAKMREKKRNQERQKQQRNREKEEDCTNEPEIVNPYKYIRDPAAPQKPFLAPRRSDNPKFTVAPGLQQMRKYRHQQEPSSTARNRPPVNISSSSLENKSLLPESVRQSLASRAPILPAGPFIRVWDSSTNGSGGSVPPPQFINSDGLEVANHWGPVDVHTELPSERLEEMFLYAPVVGVQSNNSGGAGGGREFNSSRGEKGEEEKKRKQQGQSSGVPPGRAPSRNTSAANTAINKTTITTNRTNDTLGSSLLHGAFIPSTSTEGRRAQRAAERAYNEAVIAAAATGGDEALAHALEIGSGSGGGEQTQQRGSKRRKTGGGATPKERLGKKLLSTSARAAALADSTAAENERNREKFSNRWENR
ncbi:hypothetical protein Ndes2526B_g07408 [Nannochloris sp. 'desiccata']|nr:hypothetical protein KSW81_004589 [Chlorella desiccata (nom. nud.)]KAH7618464.1 putative UV-stimulated scaffold protein A-like protein [Chlorella desiccata (nom. nud.)]